MMKKNILLFFSIGCCCAVWQAFSQLTLVIDSVPRFYTPLLDTIFVSGSFNNWNYADAQYAFVKNSDGSLSVSLTETGTIQYKISRGDQNSCETQLNGVAQSNRNYTFNGAKDTIHINIKGWNDYPPALHTATNNVFVLQSNMYIPQLRRTRRVWIYFPNDYSTSDKSYPVVYMHDGSNVFDTSQAHQIEWCVDDSLSTMQISGDTSAIVVAVDNGGKFRNDEYCPYKVNGISIGQGDEYVDFIVQTLKPFIDKTFRTKPDRLHTVIAGSSLGGFISFYAAIKYQNVFSKIAALSPSYSLSDSIFRFVKSQGLQFPMRIYQACGNYESFTMMAGLDQMKDVLLYAGFSDENLQSIFRAKGVHSETFWRIEFPLAFRWLCSDSKSTDIKMNSVSSDILVYPNPSKDILNIRTLGEQYEINQIRIIDLLGRDTDINTNSFNQIGTEILIHISLLKPGMYVLLFTSNNKLHIHRFIKR